MPATNQRMYIAEAALYLGKSEATLRHWRFHDIGPRSYIVMDGRQQRIAYDRTDLDAFKASADRPREIRGEFTAEAAGGPTRETVG